MSEETQNPQQQTQEDQYLQEAQDFFGQSMGRIKGQMQSDSAQLAKLHAAASRGVAGPDPGDDRLLHPVRGHHRPGRPGRGVQDRWRRRPSRPGRTPTRPRARARPTWPPSRRSRSPTRRRMPPGRPPIRPDRWPIRRRMPPARRPTRPVRSRIRPRTPWVTWPTRPKRRSTRRRTWRARWPRACPRATRRWASRSPTSRATRSCRARTRRATP